MFVRCNFQLSRVKRSMSFGCLFYVLRVACASLCLAVGLQVAASNAQTLTQRPSNLNHDDTAVLLYLRADQLVFDVRRNRTLVRGKVEMLHGGYVITADEVVFDQSEKSLRANGAVSLKEPDGAITTVSRLVFSDMLRNGFVVTLRSVAQDDALIAAAFAARTSGRAFDATRSQFTSCPKCNGAPAVASVWIVDRVRVLQ